MSEWKIKDPPAIRNRAPAQQLQQDTVQVMPAPARRGPAPGSRRRPRRLPPGQRLILYSMLAGAAIVLCGFVIPAGTPAPPFENIQQAAINQPFRMSKELPDLEKALRQIADQPGLRTGLFAIEPSTGQYIDVDGHERYAAASMIKVPVLVSLLTALDKGKVSFEQLLTIRPDLVAGGSGYLQWRPVDSKVSLAEAAELMIINSDNTATNMIIDVLGGPNILNKQFDDWGLRQTHIANLLPDFDGTNKTSPFDLATLISAVNAGQLVSPESRQFMFEIMARTRVRTLLPPGLGTGAKIAHKTGDIAGMVGDAGIVTAPGGKTYTVVAQVERPRNDRRANELIRSLSKVVYAGFIPDATFPAPEPVKPEPKKIVHHRLHRRHSR